MTFRALAFHMRESSLVVYTLYRKKNGRMEGVLSDSVKIKTDDLRLFCDHDVAGTATGYSAFETMASHAKVSSDCRLIQPCHFFNDSNAEF